MAVRKVNPAAGKTNTGPSGQGPVGSGQGPEVEYAAQRHDTSQWSEEDWRKNYYEFYNKPSSPKPVEWGGYRTEAERPPWLGGPPRGQQPQQPQQPQGYTVKPGDSWAKIAGDLYGDQRMFAELIKNNPQYASGLQPGQQLNLPDKVERPYISPGFWEATRAGAFGGKPAIQQPTFPAWQGGYGAPPGTTRTAEAESSMFYSPGGSATQYGGDSGIRNLTYEELTQLNQQDPKAFAAYWSGGTAGLNKYLQELGAQQIQAAQAEGGSAFGLPLIDQRTGLPIDLNKPFWEQETLRGQFGQFMGSPAGKATLIGLSILPETAMGLAAGGAPALATAAGSGLIAGALMGLAELSFNWAQSDNPILSALGKVGTWFVIDALDTPRRTGEQLLGLYFQFKGAVYEPEKYGTVEELVKNLGAAWEAAKVTYVSAPMDVKGLKPEQLAAGFTPGDWWNAIQGFESPVFVDYDLPDQTGGLSAVIEARDRIVEEKGATGVLGDDWNPFAYSEGERRRDAIIAEITARFGAPGQMRLLMSGFILDPLNYIGFIPAAALKPAAKALHATTLIKAIETLDAAAAARAAKAANAAQAGWSLKKALDYPRLFELPKEYRTALVHSTIQDVKALKFLQRALVGQDVLSVLEGKEYAPKWFEVWKHTPESNVRAQLNEVNDYLQSYVFSGAETPEDAARLLSEFADADSSKAQTGSAAEKAALALQGQAVQKMLRNGGAGWEDTLKAWRATADDRAALEAIAKATGKSVTDVAADFSAGRGKYLLDAFAKAGGELGKKFTPDYLNTTVKTFRDQGVPFTPEMAQAAMYAKVIESAANFNITHFKIKPGNFVDRLAATVKSAQTIVLLGGSPTYLINNFLNNSAMMLIHGVAGVEGIQGVVRHFADYGLAPGKTMESFSKVEFGVGEASELHGLLGDIARNFEGITGKAISEAKGTDSGPLGRIKKWTNDINGMMPFMKAAQKLEALSSANAMWQGFRQAWARSWRRGVGFERLPVELEAALRAIDPRLPDHVYAAAELGLRPRDISRAIFEAAPQPQVEAFIGSVFGERAGEVMDVLGGLKTASGVPLVKDLGSRILKRDYTPENVRRAFVETIAEGEIAAARHFEAEAKTTTAGYVKQLAGDNEMGVTDAGALLMAFDDNREMLLRTFAEHKRLVAEFWESMALGGKVDWGELEQFGNRLYRESYFVKERASLDALAEGMRRNNMPLDDGFLKAKETEYALTNDFFEAKQKRLREFFDKPYGQRTKAEWESIQAAIDSDYKRLMRRTDALRGRIDIYMAAAFEKRFLGSGQRIEAWRKLSRDHDGAYAKANVDQFSAARELRALKDRNESWRAFSERMVKQRAEWFAEESRLRRAIWEAVPGERAVKMGMDYAKAGAAEIATKAGRSLVAVLSDTSLSGNFPKVRLLDGSVESVNVLVRHSAISVDILLENGNLVSVGAVAEILDQYGNVVWSKAGQGVEGVQVGKATIEVDRARVQELVDSGLSRDAAVQQAMAEGAGHDVAAGIAVQSAAAEMASPARTLPETMTKGYIRQAWVTEFGASPEQADAVMALMDARSREWARTTGRTPDEWYTTHVAGVVKGGLADVEDGLYQSAIAAAFQKRMNGEALSMWDKIAIADFIKENATAEEAALLARIASGEEALMGGTFDVGEARRAIEAAIAQRALGEGGRGLLFQSQGDLNPVWRKEFESVGGKIDKDGTVLLYHATTAENAETILRDGVLLRPKDAPDEYGVYLGSNKSVSESYGDGTVIAVRVRVSDLSPDDVFPGRRMDFSAPTRKGIYRPVAVGDEAINWKPGLYQADSLNFIRKGAVNFLEDGRAIIHALESPDVSTMVHEVGHIFRRDLTGADHDIAATWAGATKQAEGGWKWTVEAEEKFARGFETYLKEGVAPSSALRLVFDKFKRWLGEIYKSLVGQGGLEKLTPEMRGVYDRLLADVEFEKAPAAQPTPGVEPTPARRLQTVMNAASMEHIATSTAEGAPFMAHLRNAINKYLPEGTPKFTDAELGNLTAERHKIAIDAITERARVKQTDTTAFVEQPRDQINPAISEALDKFARDVRQMLSGLQGPVQKGGMTIEGGAEVKRYGYTPSQRPEWAQEFVANTKGMTYDKLDGLMAKIVEDAGKDKGVNVARAKRWLLGLMTENPSPIDGTPPDPTILQLMGRSEEEVQAARSAWDALRQAQPDLVRVPDDVLVGDTVTWQGKQWNVIDNEGALTLDDGVESVLLTPDQLLTGQVVVAGRAERPMLFQTAASEWFDSQWGRVRLIEHDDAAKAWIVEKQDGTRMLVKDDAGPLFAPPGWMAERGAWPRPGAEAGQEVWYRQARPMLTELQEAMTADAGMPRLKQLDGAQLDEASMGMLRDWVSNTEDSMGQAKLLSLKHAEYKRDAALLNYSRRYGYNTVLDPFFPYHFFTTESMVKWAMLAVQKPAILANYWRLNKFFNEQVKRPGFPTRLAGKVRIPLPFMPDWMGGGVWVDPMRVGLPIDNFLRPWENYAERQAVLTNKTDALLKQWVDDGKITSAEYEAARSGQNDLVKQAQTELLKQDPSLRYDAADAFMNFLSPSLPLNWAYQYLRGTPERIGPTPLTRTVKSVTSMMGVGGPGGWNMEEGIRQKLGLPIFDQWTDYRVDRALAAMAAEGLITAEQARAAMIERQGRVFDRAVERQTQEQSWGQTGLLLGQSGSFFTSGEQEQRAIRLLNSAAWAAEKAGDTKALERFYDMYPEYAAQLALYDDPQERLNKFLVSQVYQGYFALPSLYRNEVMAQLGPQFEQAFGYQDTEDGKALSKAVRENLDAETLAAWARTLGRYAPTNVNGKAIPIQFAPPAIAAAYQGYMALYGQYKTDEVRALEKKYFSIPEDKRVNVAPPDVQAFLNARNQQFPGIFDAQDQYYALKNAGNTGGAKQFLSQHPQLKAYWDWNRSAKTPEVKAYLDSDAPITRSSRSIWLDTEEARLLAEWWKIKYGYLDQHLELKPYMDVQDSNAQPTGGAALEQAGPLTLPPEAWRLLTASVLAGYDLPPSLNRSLEKQWRAMGSPGTYEYWLMGLVGSQAAQTTYQAPLPMP